MNLDILKGSPEVNMNTEAEKKIYEYLNKFKLEKFTGREKIELSPSELQIKYYRDRLDLKKGIKNGEVVGVDCLNRYFIYYCTQNKALFLLQIEFDLNEIFGSDVTGLMDLREEKILGNKINFEEADTIIDNYIEWTIENRSQSEKEKIEKSTLEDQKFDKWFDLA